MGKTNGEKLLFFSFFVDFVGNGDYYVLGILTGEGQGEVQPPFGVKLLAKVPVTKK